ncbi:hypothetical protein F7P69_00840 [Cellulosimicrobium funkei]|nr:hypothetical protein [Cellulosimicrobium funkei]
MMREYMAPRGWQTIDQWRDAYPADDQRGDIVDYTATEPGHLTLIVDTDDPTHADLFTHAHVIVGAIGHSRPAEFETATVRTKDNQHSATFTCTEIPGCKTEPWPEH